MAPLNSLLAVCVMLFGLFGIFVISTSRGDRQANFLLGTFFLLWSLDFLDGLLMTGGFYLSYPNLALWSEALVFLYGPILYFYTVRILSGQTVIKRQSILHLIPFAVMTALTAVSFHTLPHRKKVDILQGVLEATQSPMVYLVGAAIFMHFIAYILISKRKIQNKEKQLSQYYSNYNIQWIHSLLNSLLIILCISVAANATQYLQSGLYYSIALPLLLIVMTVIIVNIFWKSLQQPFLWLAEEPIVKYQGSSMIAPEKDSIQSKIVDVLTHDRLYRNPELTISDLSKHIGHHPREVSQVINEVFEMTFFNLINSYRITEAKQLLLEANNSKVTVQEVMYDVGFNSKSSFYTQFKKQTGMTPTEFSKSA